MEPILNYIEISDQNNIYKKITRPCIKEEFNKYLKSLDLLTIKSIDIQCQLNKNENLNFKIEYSNSRKAWSVKKDKKDKQPTWFTCDNENEMDFLDKLYKHLNCELEIYRRKYLNSDYFNDSEAKVSW